MGIREWLTTRRARREVDRQIPWPYSTLLSAEERDMWGTGWRINYWVCPKCGRRRAAPDWGVWRVPILCPEHEPDFSWGYLDRDADLRRRWRGGSA